MSDIYAIWFVANTREFENSWILNICLWARFRKFKNFENFKKMRKFADFCGTLQDFVVKFYRFFFRKFHFFLRQNLQIFATIYNFFCVQHLVDLAPARSWPAVFEELLTSPRQVRTVCVLN